MSNQFLLSICIPTYNRADMLDATLSHLLGDPDFDDQLIEVVVADNASTDHTQHVVAKYPQVKYHRNEYNIKDANFAVVLNIAQGKYLKLVNDTLRFNSGKLKVILDLVRQTDAGVYNLLFYKNFVLYQDTQIELRTKKELLQYATFYTTWIANFGIWKSDFDSMTDKNRYVETQFLQVDWSYRNIDNGKLTKLIIEDFFDVVPLTNKGGYSIFDTFINKYLSVIKKHDVSLYRFSVEKYRLLRYFVLHWYFLLKKDKEYTFDTSNSAIIFQKYWYEPYFWPLYLLKFIRK